MRRVAEILIACALLALTLPLMGLIALSIKCDSSGPVFERHTRIGPGGRRFHSFKFRTRECDQQRITPAWSRKCTPIGELLRYTRLDALPQLINVLRGEMTVFDSEGMPPSFLE
jgi:lipopolysaccharide/colanic/teichoic acid biosynthesis glycosyltransferase